MGQEDWDGSVNQDREAHITEVLADPKLELNWLACLSDDPEITPRHRQGALAYVKSIRDSFVKTVSDITDPCEQMGVTAVFYAYLTAQWILFNTQAGYQAQTNQVDRDVLCRAGLISATLGAIEHALSAQTSEVVRLFFSELVQATGDDTALTNYKLSGRNPSLRSLHAEHVSLRAELQRLFTESGTDSVEATIQHWRETRNELGRAAATSAQAQSYMTAFALEFGENVSPKDVIQKVRLLNDEIGFLGSDLEAARLTWQTMGREFGVSSPEQIMQMVRDLRDRISDLTQENASTGSDVELLRREIGNVSIPEIIQELTTLREQQMSMEEELIHLRAQKRLLQQELGQSDANAIIALMQAQKEQAKTLQRESVTYRSSQESVLKELGIDDAEEIVTRIRALNARGNAFGELSSLLGNMDQVLTTFSA